jgi:hypothetical protein
MTNKAKNISRNTKLHTVWDQIVGTVQIWMMSKKDRQALRRFEKWKTGLKPKAYDQLSALPIPPKYNSQTLEPKIEVWLEGNEIYLKNCEAGSLLIKGLSSSQLNGWWLPKVNGKRKPVLPSLERAETSIWILEEEEYPVRIRVWCCRLERLNEEFVLEREVGWHMHGVASQQQLN